MHKTSSKFPDKQPIKIKHNKQTERYMIISVSHKDTAGVRTVMYTNRSPLSDLKSYKNKNSIPPIS